MSLIQKVTAFFTGRRAGKPVGTVHVVDPNPLNWLYITYNTVEELVRVTPVGITRSAAMKTYRWLDDRTLEIDVRQGNRFPDGELITAATVKRAFDEAFRWRAPHPPGTHFNLDPRTRCEIVGDYRVQLHLPEPDGLALGKLRAYHIMSTAFWAGPGFGYARNGSGEGHW
jgi:ABC-type transport system substrate-binding protein